MTTTTTTRRASSSDEAARHLCQEARVVLCSLRGGPPAVARGELAHDLQDLRVLVRAHLESLSPLSSFDVMDVTDVMDVMDVTEHEHEHEHDLLPPLPTTRTTNTATNTNTAATNTTTNTATNTTNTNTTTNTTNNTLELDDVGPFVRPFLSIVMDPRAAGPHTLVALRALFRLLSNNSFQGFPIRLEPLMRGVLQCKFEQTDAGADEAVEMAIADLLALLVTLDTYDPNTMMDAFNTVFVTRNTFVHSPALCYHFEDVLVTLVKSVFSRKDHSAKLILQFLVNQLLHMTPINCGSTLPLSSSSSTTTTTSSAAAAAGTTRSSSISDEPARDAQMAHDATRVLCLKLARCSLQIQWDPTELTTDNPFIKIIQDDLCLALLLTGQAIWSYHGSSSSSSTYGGAPVSMDVLSEICATIAALWNKQPFRHLLVAQFETIFTGFYQRALVLLRQRQHPIDSNMFNENLVFDAELEVILESLVDLLCLPESESELESALSTTDQQPPQQSQHATSSTLETLFRTYDCDLGRYNVAEHLFVELSLCCGAVAVDEATSTTAAASLEQQSVYEIVEHHHQQCRPVPPHLKELCAEAMLGCLKALFRMDDDSTNINNNTNNNASAELPFDLDHSSSVKTDEEAAAATTGKAIVFNKKLSHRTVKSRKRQFSKAAKLFNEKPSKGIDFLVKSGLLEETAPDVASFLRNGLVLGLDKAKVGMYLGELGKAASAGKSPPTWERDWFHKEVLAEFCSLFKFENQPLIDGLRMFLASFRIPGEAQQIDRIVQAFADSCGKRCDEATTRNIFSEDPKRASDTAFLLAFSIIMLNTDQHNPNMKDDSRMDLNAFVRNNADYGRDITEKGKELPRDFLESIFKSIREEEIKTEAEGARGNMTVERWKDVLRGSTVALFSEIPESDPVDLKELLVETVWMPVVSTIGAFWAVIRSQQNNGMLDMSDHNHSGMLSAQGARLGMDIALELLTGVRNVGRVDLFQQVFSTVCSYTGLLGDYNHDAVERTIVFVNSVESQSAVIVCIRIAQECADDLGMEGWMRLWSIIFELRDLKMLGGGTTTQRKNLLLESDTDLLTPESRREWKVKLAKGGFDDGHDTPSIADAPRSFFGGLGRALFGSEDIPDHAGETAETSRIERVYSIHGKEELYLWDEFASSDDEEDEVVNTYEDEQAAQEKPAISRFSTPGAIFESQLIHEDMLVQHQIDMPITGLERVEDTRPYQISPRARVRKRLARACEIAGIVSESRFMELGGTVVLLEALVTLIEESRSQEQESSTGKETTTSEPVSSDVVLSPASEALAEVLLCEIAIRNKDRLASLWSSVLENHYASRIQTLIASQTAEHDISRIEPGTEKCVTGLLRLCACAAQKEDIGNEVIGSLALLTETATPREIEELDKHISEGTWRICSSVDSLLNLNDEGWQSLLMAIRWCAARAGKYVGQSRQSGRSAGLAEDDPGLQAYRSLHLILHAPELLDVIPDSVADAVSTLVTRTAEVGCANLCLAGIGLLHVVQSRHANQICTSFSQSGAVDVALVAKWSRVLISISKAAGDTQDMVVRSQTISTLTDAFLDKQGSSIPPSVLRVVLPQVCIQFANQRVLTLLENEVSMVETSEDVMIEFEQCISLIFKPFLHHAKSIVHSTSSDLEIIWTALLKAMESLLQIGADEMKPSGSAMTPGMLRWTLKELASEHLRNVIMVLHAHGVLKGNPAPSDRLSIATWESIDRMSFCKGFATEWRQSASHTDIPVQSRTHIPEQSKTDIPGQLNADVPEQVNADVTEQSNTDVTAQLNTDVTEQWNADVPEQSNADIPEQSNTDIPEQLNDGINELVEE